jgi:hypothetical protein
MGMGWFGFGGVYGWRGYIDVICSSVVSCGSFVNSLWERGLVRVRWGSKKFGVELI